MHNRNYDALDAAPEPAPVGLSVGDDGLVPDLVHEGMDLVLGFSCFLFFLAARGRFRWVDTPEDDPLAAYCW